MKTLYSYWRAAAWMAAAAIVFSGCGRPGDDRQHVTALIAASEQMLEQENVDSAWALLEHAYDEASRHHDGSALAETCLAMARHHNMMDRPDSAIVSLKRGLAAYPEAHDSLLAQYYGELSATYNIKGDMRQSVDYGLLALPLMRQYGSEEDVAITCGNMGISYRRLGQNDSAAILYQQGLQVAMQAADAESQAYLSNNLSVLYADMGRYDESIAYADKAAEASRQAGDDVERLSAQANKGVALLLNGQTDDAVSLLKFTAAQADSTGSTPLKLKTLNYLLKALMEKHQWDAATVYLQQGEALAAQLPQAGTAAAGILEAKMIVLTEQGRYTEALLTIQRLEQLMQQQQVIPRHKLLACKARCLAALGRYPEAYHLQRQSSVESDSVKSREASRKLDALTTSYRVMEKELELSHLREQQAASQQKNAVLLALLVLALLLLALLLLFLRQRRQQAQMRETRRYVNGMEQERARFARELHDGACNELLAIGMQLRQPQPDVSQVGRQVSTLRTQLRNLSHELMPPQFSDGVLLHEALGHYLSHLELPGLSFQAEGTGWEQLPANVAYQYYRIAQEAIGNIIVHQAEPQVQVSARCQLPHLQLLITSRGSALPGDGTGIGLQSLRDRASSIGAQLTTHTDADVFTLRVDYGTP